MPSTRPPHAPEFRRQIVDLVRAGRDPVDLAREFEPSVQAIRNWVAEADRQAGRGSSRPATVTADASLSAGEREELARLRRENKQLKLERDPKGAPLGVRSALAPRPGLRARRAFCPRALRIRERQPGRLPGCRHGPRARRVASRVLRVGLTPALG